MALSKHFTNTHADTYDKPLGFLVSYFLRVILGFIPLNQLFSHVKPKKKQHMILRSQVVSSTYSAVSWFAWCLSTPGELFLGPKYRWSRHPDKGLDEMTNGGVPPLINIPIGSMVLVYMLTWLGYIDGIHVTIYSSTMDPSWDNKPWFSKIRGWH